MKRKNNILTYEEATKIVENSNGVFTESKHLIDGFNISIFNYRLATYENFVDEEIEITENEETITILGCTIINNKKVSEYSDDELRSLGFQYLSKFKV